MQTHSQRSAGCLALACWDCQIVENADILAAGNLDFAASIWGGKAGLAQFRSQIRTEPQGPTQRRHAHVSGSITRGSNSGNPVS